MFGGAADPPRGGRLGSLQVALHAVEAMRRQLASELGEYGVRVVTLLTSGIPETIPEDVPARQPISEAIERSTLLGRAATLEDVGGIAAFVASDHARTITGASINISSGTADARLGRSAGATRVSPEKPDRGPIGIAGTERAARTKIGGSLIGHVLEPKCESLNAPDFA